MTPDESYKLTVTQKPSHLYAVVTGANNRQNVERYLEEILHECMVRGCKKVLIEERLEGPRLDTLDVFDISSEASIRALGYFTSIAYVDVKAEGNLMQFAQIVAANRWLPVRVFSSVSDAEKWLLGSDR